MRKKETDHTTIRLKKTSRKKLLIAVSRYTALIGEKVTTSEFLEYLCEKYAEHLERIERQKIEMKKSNLPPPPEKN